MKMPSNREAVLLDILINGKKAGRDINTEYRSRTGKELPLGSLYTTLSRMIDEGFITFSYGEGTPERRGFPRKFFSITGAGQSALNDYQLFIISTWEGLFQNG